MENSNSGQAQQQPSRAWTAVANSAAKKRLCYCYGWAFDCLHLWMQPAVVPPTPPPAEQERLRFWSSPKAAASAFARLLCLCAAPPCSYEDVLLGVHVDAAPPTPIRRRRRRRRRARRYGASSSVPPSYRGSVVRHALIRRLMIEELATRQREDMEAVHVMSVLSQEKRKPPGNSRLRWMALPDGPSS